MAAADPDVFDRARQLVTPGMRAAVDRLNSATRQVAGYHLGWWDEHGVPATGDNGKAVRPALAMLSAQAVGGAPTRAAAPGAAVELVHNYSLLHDDVMDQDEVRRHRPTAWNVYGVPAAILAGDALLTLGGEALVQDGPPLAAEGIPRLDAALLRLIDGQVADMGFEGRCDVRLDECLAMAGDKTSSLFAVACELGALAGGGSPYQVELLRQFGEHLGLVFQLVDDLKGIWGDPAATGKPVLADLRARKKSLPVVAALNAHNGAARQLAELYHGPEELDEAQLLTAADLVERAGGRAWASAEIRRQLDQALACLTTAGADPAAAAELTALARRLSVEPGTPTGADQGGRSAGVTEPASDGEPAATRAAPFQLPAPAATVPARLNPHLDRARAHCLAWARQMGLLETSGGIRPWTAEQLAADEYGLLAAYTHPDADAHTLDTLADWYLWAFYLDDYLAEAQRCGGTGLAHTLLARLAEFVPADPAQGTPRPTSPAERGLADLWRRTAPDRSVNWRARFRDHFAEYLEGQRRELVQTEAGTVPSPIEYLELKRRTNGGQLGACLIEHERAFDLPESLRTSLTMHTLRDAFVDHELLRNDLFSYQREVENGESANMVVVLEHFLGCDPQRAANTTSDLASARLEQFEQTAGTELPVLFEEYGLAPSERLGVLDYLRGLREFQAGWEEWHRRAGRYAVSETTTATAAPAVPTASARPLPPAAALPPVVRRLGGPTGLGTRTASAVLPREAVNCQPATSSPSLRVDQVLAPPVAAHTDTATSVSAPARLQRGSQFPGLASNCAGQE